MLSTGEAAKRLGVSPRTVARMIDRGDLPGYRIGGHRRVVIDNARPSVPDSQSRRFTQMLGTLIAATVIQHPDQAFGIAENNLARQRHQPTQSSHWTDRWTELIVRRDFAGIIDALTDVDDRSGLRRTHPFSGLISEDQRLAAFEASR